MLGLIFYFCISSWLLAPESKVLLYLLFDTTAPEIESL